MAAALLVMDIELLNSGREVFPPKIAARSRTTIIGRV